MTKEYPWGKGTVKWTRDATTNDSDKSFTVPTGKIWHMIGIRFYLTATATVGNRIPSIYVAPDGANYFVYFQGAALTASNTGQYMVSFQGVSDDFTAAAAVVQGSMPMILPAGAIVRVYDVGAVDAAADDMVVLLHYVEYDV